MEEIRPGSIDGIASAPPSKSMMQRAIAAAALANGKSVIGNPSTCEDALAAMKAVEAIGASVDVSGGKALVNGGGKKTGGKLDCGESGLCMRMLSPVCSLFDNEFVLSGRGSLLERQAGMIEGPLRQLGAKCETNKGKPPITIHGPIHGGEIEIDGSQSSQFLTGLLMALPLCKEDSVVKVKNLKSKPYVQMTLGLLEKFGIAVEASGKLDEFRITGRQRYTPANYDVEGDWSGAAFLLVAGAIAGRVTVSGLREDSLQADRAIVDALQKAGAKVNVQMGEVDVRKGTLVAFDFDAADCPDLFPPLAVLACNCKGKSRLKGALRLKGKESDRGAALVSELGKLGAKITVEGDEMTIMGGTLSGGEVDSHNDHRIAMACAVAALNCSSGVRITNENCVAKSYPKFFEDLEKIRVVL